MTRAPSAKQSNASAIELLASWPAERREAWLKSLSPTDVQALEYSWAFNGRPKQQEPEGDAWVVWLILAGRGFGKTRTGAEWVRRRVDAGARRIYIVGRSAGDVRDVMVEGESGILACSPPWNRPEYEPSKRRLTWKNGAIATTFSADEPDQLRGPQCDTAWADEIAAWRYEDTWDQLRFGLRSRASGLLPRAIVTTTPRPTTLIRSLVRDSRTFTTRGSTYENAANLAESFLTEIRRKYEGTRLGRQELFAEILDDAPGALWKRTEIESHRVRVLPALRSIVVAVDPAVTSGADSALTGIVVVAVGADGHGYVLEDASDQYTPEGWAAKVLELVDDYEANYVVAEVNNGGDLVASNLRTHRRSLHIKQVRASRGKWTRAEPVAALYEQGLVHHVGLHGPLEDQLCSWEPVSGAPSPDRMDALVWGVTDLMVIADPKVGRPNTAGTRTTEFDDLSIAPEAAEVVPALALTQAQTANLAGGGGGLHWTGNGWAPSAQELAKGAPRALAPDELVRDQMARWARGGS